VVHGKEEPSLMFVKYPMKTGYKTTVLHHRDTISIKMKFWNRLREFIQDLPAALVILNPSKGIGLILRNCIHLDGKFSQKRAKEELFHFFYFIIIFIAVPVIYIGSNIGAIWIVNKYIVPIPFAVKIFGSFSFDEEVWEANIERDISDMGAVSRQYTQWSSQQGMSSETSETIQKLLWHSWPVYLGLGLFIGITFYMIVIRFCLLILRDYQKSLVKRKMAYFDQDLRIIPRDKIL
jgi:energy-coupling factor transporter transmembrane protein EcfT